MSLKTDVFIDLLKPYSADSGLLSLGWLWSSLCDFCARKS